MKYALTALAFVAVLVAIAAVLATQRKNGRAAVPLKPRKPLTDNEQPMYFRLRETFPEHVVLAQVAFSALLTASNRAGRNTFDRKVADFVLCTKAFEVVAVIELDDSSHKGRAASDAARDRLLTTAGYRVIRFQRTPDVAALRTAIAPNVSPQA